MFFAALGAAILGSGATAAAAYAAGALITNLALTAASMAYQMSQASKQKKLAAAAAEARKGFEAVSEGLSTPLPIVYGRAKVGGQRVWLNTTSKLKLGVNNANTVISTFDELTEQSSVEASFVHPGTAGFRVTFDATVLAALGTSVLTNNTVAFYRDVTVLGSESPHYQMSQIERQGLPSNWTITVTNLDSTGFNVTISTPDSMDLTSAIFFYKLPFVKNVVELPGEKNEFLIMQQALCQAPIHQVYDIMMDDQRFIDDADMGDSKQSLLLGGTMRAGTRAECYLNGGVAHSNTVLNFIDRKDAKFTQVASASIFIKLDRNSPAFNDIPVVTFFIEGRTVRYLSKVGDVVSLESGRIYSNNPALCLLDYLLDATCGKALDISEIDLNTFYNASLICAKIVQTGVYAGGKVWQPTNKSRVITTRDLPLYECNIIVDVTKTVRANVESILSTMGDARLVWSGGKYKLNLQYPGGNP
jgi:hypothetical protein